MGWELITPDSLAELDSTQNTKLGGIATGATVGATVGTNFFKSGTTTNYGVGEFENGALGFSVSNNSLTLGRGSASSLVLSGLGQGLVGLSGVVNNADVTSANTSANTSNVGNQSVANAQTAVARANAGLNSSGDVVRSVSTTYGGTGSSDVTTFRNNSISISSSNNSLSVYRGAYGNSTISSLSQELVGLSGVVNNADVTGSNTAYDTARVNGTTASTVRTGAASGATANQDSTSTIRNGVTKSMVGLGSVDNNSTSTIRNGVTKSMVGLGSVPNYTAATMMAQNHTGSLNGVAAATVTSGAASGATANQDSTATIRNGVVTFVTSATPSVVWSNLSGNMTPSASNYYVTVTFKNGSGTTVQTTQIKVSRTSNSLNAATVNSGSSTGVSLGAAKIAGVTQTTTVTYSGITCTITGLIIDGSGWNFK